MAQKTIDERLNDTEEIVDLLKDLVSKVRFDQQWGGFVGEMLNDYERRRDELEEQYHSSPEYLEFAPSYIGMMQQPELAPVLR